MIRALLQADRPVKLDWLARGELDRAAAMAVPWRREDFLLGRWAAKRLVSSVLGCAPGPAMEIRAAASGRPEAFLDGHPLRLSLSISHRERLALAAVDDAGKPLGADLEAVEARSDAFVRDYFTASEIAAVAAGEPDLMANLIWSAKESALKALGVGLTVDTRDVEVELAPGRGAGWRAFRLHGATEWGGWWRREGARILTLVGASAGEPQLLS
jgi:4'-phosphopantetheinyl transferase